MDNSERDDTIEFELNSGSPWVEFHDDGSPPHVADDWETQAVDVSFGHRTEFFYTHKLVRTWPFFAKLLNEPGREAFARGAKSAVVKWPGGATRDEFELLMRFVASRDQENFELAQPFSDPPLAMFPACAMAYLAGKAFHPELAELGLRKLFEHCDTILMDAFQYNHLSSEPDNPSFEQFEIVELADALDRIYRPGVAVNTKPIRNILIPFIWIMETRTKFGEIQKLARRSDQFAADMGRHVLNLNNPRSAFQPPGYFSHRKATRYGVDCDQGKDHCKGCVGCGSLPKEKGDVKMESDSENESNRPMLYNPFATVVVWKYTRYWCEDCWSNLDNPRDTPPWRPQQDSEMASTSGEEVASSGEESLSED